MSYRNHMLSYEHTRQATAEYVSWYNEQYSLSNKRMIKKKELCNKYDISIRTFERFLSTYYDKITHPQYFYGMYIRK